MKFKILSQAMAIGLLSEASFATPTIYPKDITLLSKISNSTNSNLVADDSDVNVIWVMPPNVAISKVSGLHTITANVGFCQELANLQGYSEMMSRKMKDLELKELDSEEEVKAIEVKLSAARQDYAQYVAANNLIELQSIDDRLATVDQQIETLNEKLSSCQENCNEYLSQIKQLKTERAQLTSTRLSLLTQRMKEAREMQRKKALVEAYQQDLKDKDERWSKLRSDLDSLRTKFNEMYKTFGQLEGARASISFESEWDKNINQLQQQNPGFDFKRILTQNAQITTNIVGINSFPTTGAIMGYDIAGNHSEGKISFSSYPQSMAGNVRLSLIGTCPILHPEWFKITTDNSINQMKYGMVVSYEFPSTFEVDVTAKYNMYKIYQKIVSSGRSGGFFSTRHWTSIEEKTFFKDDFKVSWNEQDSANSLTEEQKADYEREIRNNIFGRLASLGLPAVSNPGSLVPPQQLQSGALILANSLANNSACKMNIYCTSASIGLSVLDAIFGQSSASANYTNIQNVEMTESWSRKKVVYKPWISSYR
ncbi:MAG: hypothetical protein AB7I27_00045 [Bacteriovoracaceae bacterium]